jgi:hypothetical protein
MAGGRQDANFPVDGRQATMAAGMSSEAVSGAPDPIESARASTRCAFKLAIWVRSRPSCTPTSRLFGTPSREERITSASPLVANDFLVRS